MITAFRRPVLAALACAAVLAVAAPAAGEAGKNGGVAVTIFQGAEAKSPFEGSATLTDAQAADLMAGRLYVNIHTAANKAGEIRGQVVK